MINVLTYNAPHRKTQDLLFRLKAKGYNDVCVLATPWEERKNFRPLIPHRQVDFLNIDKEEGKELKKFLFNHQIKKEFVFSFEWEKNSIAIWDNWSILHQATPFSGNRVMHRITVQ